VQPVEPLDEDELNILWCKLQRLELMEGSLNEYLAVDDELAVGGTRTLAEIAADVKTTEVDETEAER
jgi:hypothetical protein